MATIRTRQRGKTWSYSFDAYTLEGKRKIVEKGGFETKQIAYDEGVKAFAKYKGGDIRFSAHKVTVIDFLNTWLNERKIDFKPNTFCGYAKIISKLAKFLGNKKLQELSPRDVNNLMNKLFQLGYAKGTLCNYLKVLKMSLSYAVYPAELISVNPAMYIKVPKNAPTNVIKRQIITKEKLDFLLKTFPFGHPLHIPILLSYHTGLRLGETLGACWEDIDWDKNELTVCRQLSFNNAVGYYFSTLKTKTSYRQILLDSQIMAILKKWRKTQLKTEISKGQTYIYNYEDKNGMLWGIPKSETPKEGMILRKAICTRDDGCIVKRNTLLEQMRRCGINFHSLRHTHATQLIENGAIPKDVATRLGHSDATITQNLYTHDTEQMKRNTVAIFEKILATG